jgi:hypothetical protein
MYEGVIKKAVPLLGLVGAMGLEGTDEVPGQ